MIMPTFQDVQQALDRSVGGVQIGAHGAFWRGLTRDQFIAKKVFGRPIVTMGNAAESNIIKALRGQAPFGADIGTPDATIPRMPAFLPPMPEEDINLIAQWIDQTCPE
jgi:hypothetical protein